jgi:hypothetical protein
MMPAGMQQQLAQLGLGDAPDLATLQKLAQQMAGGAGGAAAGGAEGGDDDDDDGGWPGAGCRLPGGPGRWAGLSGRLAAAVTTLQRCPTYVASSTIVPPPRFRRLADVPDLVESFEEAAKA